VRQLGGGVLDSAVAACASEQVRGPVRPGRQARASELFCCAKPALTFPLTAMKIISELAVVPSRSLTALIRISCLAHEASEVSDVRTTPSAGDWVLQPSPSLRDRDLRRERAEDSGSLSFFLLPPDWWVFPLVSGIKAEPSRRSIPECSCALWLWQRHCCCSFVYLTSIFLFQVLICVQLIYNSNPCSCPGQNLCYWS
jgi:hypothetical protein